MIQTIKEVGYVTRSRDYLVRIEGLPSAKLNDIIISQTGALAIISSLSNTAVTALILNHHLPKPGDQFTKPPHGIEIPRHDELLGRIINPVGIPIDNGVPFGSEKETVRFEVVADGINYRHNITKQFMTGITVIDSLLPIGQGQRQMLLGEPRSGKGIFLSNIIMNQAKTDPQIYCIYAAIGKSNVDLQKFYGTLKSVGADKYTVIVAAVSSETAPAISLTPTVAMAIAESFRKAGKSTLVILDDMGSQAKYLREITLLSDRVPGRELYPGDIFYQQAHLFERAGHFKGKDESSSVSITLLPVLEANKENYTNLIATNIMGSTDGHMLFSALDRSEGRYPPVIIHRSVTRLGRQTQTMLYQQLADRLRRLMEEYQYLTRFNRFGTNVTNIALKRGKILNELLQQQEYTKTTLSSEAILLSLMFTRYFDMKDVKFIKQYRRVLSSTIEKNNDFLALQTELPKLSLNELIKKLEDSKYAIALDTAIHATSTKSTKNNKPAITTPEELSTSAKNNKL